MEFVPVRYSVDGQRVVSLAAAEARTLGHSRVGTEHLMLGLLGDVDGKASAMLRTSGASLAAARHKVAEVSGAGDAPLAGEALPLSARAQRAIERAGRFSRRNREPEVTTEHLLLGVLDVEGLASQVLRGIGVDLAHLRHALTESRAEVMAGLVVPRVDDPPTVGSERPRCPGCRAALQDTLASSVMASRGDDGTTTEVRAVFCSACGVTIGVVPPVIS